MALIHGFLFPEMGPGWAGTLEGTTARVLSGEVPQAILATTLTFPAVLLGVTDTVVEVEVPVHPDGKVQV
jgi:hypothetical protein